MPNSCHLYTLSNVFLPNMVLRLWFLLLCISTICSRWYYLPSSHVFWQSLLILYRDYRNLKLDQQIKFWVQVPFGPLISQERNSYDRHDFFSKEFNGKNVFKSDLNINGDSPEKNMNSLSKDYNYTLHDV
jgi:hypothetical protein